MIARVPRTSTPAGAAGLGPRVSRSTPADARAFVTELQRTAGNRALRSFLRSRTTRLQRDLSAYGKARVEFLPSMGEGAGVVTALSESAEAAGVRAALAKLIEQGKVKEVTSAGGKSWFAANHHKNAQLDEIRRAFADAGYDQADKLARALYDIHAEYLYSATTATTSTIFGSTSTSSRARLHLQRNRTMTEHEIRQARRVFGDAIDYTKVRINEGSISARVASVGGYARTIGNTIHMPEGGSRNMAFMIHELTHVWQYQRQGWTYAPRCIWAQITEGYSYVPSELDQWNAHLEGRDPLPSTPDEALRSARQEGKTLQSFNLEQQGDILADYFRRQQRGEDVSAYAAYVGDVR